ncbi:MAG: hypothetical protein ABH852_05700 [Methanobacteriota archaeon]
MNIDARADPFWLGRLVHAASNERDSQVGMWGGLILAPNESRISSAGHTLREDGAFLDVDWNRDPVGDLKSNLPVFEPFCPCFAASLWSFSLIEEAGLPDSGQFLYYDDVELAYKARILGWRAAFVRDALAYHPMPNTKRTVDRQRQLQLRGKLLIVVRYFPDSRARSFLLSLSDEERELLSAVDARDRRSFKDDEHRAAVYNEWANKWL